MELIMTKKLLLVIAALTMIATPVHANCGIRGVFVFSAYWCPACRATEQFLASYRVSYQRLEVTGNQQVQQFMREHFGTTAIPVVVVDGNHVLGYDAVWLREALCLR
jgi:glutaredoxin